MSGGGRKLWATLASNAPLPPLRRSPFPVGEGKKRLPLRAVRRAANGVKGLLENALSLRTSAHAGVAIPRISKHLGSKTKLFPSNRGAATPVTSVTGSQRHTFLTAP